MNTEHTLWASGPRKAGEEGAGRVVQTTETAATARRRMAVASVIRYGTLVHVP